MPLLKAPLSSRQIQGLSAILLTALVAWIALECWQIQAQASVGAALFQGKAAPAPPARLNRHAMDLPAAATACINCHQIGYPNKLARNVPFGGWLSSQQLTQLRARRGGPPSRFDAASLCELLRSGRDPALVIVNTTMPRYEVNAAQCEALWTYLNTAEPSRP